MIWNIILAVVSISLVFFILVKRKGWKTALIIAGILTAILIISGIGGLIINPFL